MNVYVLSSILEMAWYNKLIKKKIIKQTAFLFTIIGK